MRSFSEIDTAVKRASKGIGFSWGISEEVGKNIRLLEMFGLPGLKNLNQYYKIFKEKKFQNLTFPSTVGTRQVLPPGNRNWIQRAEISRLFQRIGNHCIRAESLRRIH